MRTTVISALLLCVAVAAHAQQTVEQQVYGATAAINHAALNLGQRLIDDEVLIISLRKQIADLTKELDELKAKDPAAK